MSTQSPLQSTFIYMLRHVPGLPDASQFQVADKNYYVMWTNQSLKLIIIALNSDITSRTFSLAKFLSDHNNHLTPAGLCFFQATWDESVTQTFMEMLGTVFKYLL